MGNIHISSDAKNVLYAGVGCDIYTAFELAPNLENLYLIDKNNDRYSFGCIIASFYSGKYAHFDKEGNEIFADVPKVTVLGSKGTQKKKEIDIIYMGKPRKVYFLQTDYLKNRWPDEVKDLDVIITIGATFNDNTDDSPSVRKNITNNLTYLLITRTSEHFVYYHGISWGKKQKAVFNGPYETRFHNKVSYILCDKSDPYKWLNYIIHEE